MKKIKYIKDGGEMEIKMVKGKSLLRVNFKYMGSGNRGLWSSIRKCDIDFFYLFVFYFLV